VGPFKTNPPAVIDADAVLAFAFADQRLETVTRQCREIFQRSSGLNTIELHARVAFDPGERLNSFPIGELSRPLIPDS
jgi:hypothetical protein